MIKKIAHTADIHITKSLKRHQEYKEVFINFFNSLKETKPDRVVVVGDLFHNFIDHNNEAITLAGWFLNKCSKLTNKVIVVRGNHDVSVKHKKRIDSIKTVVSLIDNENVIYYDKSGFYVDDNVCWVVFDHLDKINPYKELAETMPERDKYKFIDLYHNPVFGCTNDIGYEFTEKKHTKITDFKGDYVMLGDIHKRQFFT